VLRPAWPRCWTASSAAPDATCRTAPSPLVSRPVASARAIDESVTASTVNPAPSAMVLTNSSRLRGTATRSTVPGAEGLASPAGPTGPTMPAFADMLDDRQVAELVAYLRSRFTGKPAWPDLGNAVAQARQGGGR